MENVDEETEAKLAQVSQVHSQIYIQVYRISFFTKPKVDKLCLLDLLVPYRSNRMGTIGLRSSVCIYLHTNGYLCG